MNYTNHTHTPTISDTSSTALTAELVRSNVQPTSDIIDSGVKPLTFAGAINSPQINSFGGKLTPNELIDHDGDTFASSFKTSTVLETLKAAGLVSPTENSVSPPLAVQTPATTQIAPSITSAENTQVTPVVNEVSMDIIAPSNSSINSSTISQQTPQISEFVQNLLQKLIWTIGPHRDWAGNPRINALPGEK